MINPGHSPSSGGRKMTEVSVAGRLGPVFRAAFSDQRITTRSECTVIRTGPATDREVTDLVRALVERGLVVQSVHRLPDVPAPPARVEHHDLRPTERLSLRRQADF